MCGGSEPPPPKFLERMATSLPEGFILKIPKSWDENTLCAEATDADAILGGIITRELIVSAPRLRFIQTLSAGMEKIDIDAANERGIVVCNAVGVSSVWIAEHALALMLALAKNLYAFKDEFQSTGSWVRKPTVKLAEKKLGIIGLGNIGTEVAKRIRPFGMKILAIKRHPDDELKNNLGLFFLGGPESLDYLLTESDFVILSAVLTKETKGMIGEPQLKKMKRTAFLINVGQGELVDEVALVKALNDGTLAGAGLDVFRSQPIKANDPLLRLKNVILTPNVGGGAYSEEADLNRVNFLVDNITKGLCGKKPANIVDPFLKYARNMSTRV